MTEAKTHNSTGKASSDGYSTGCLLRVVGSGCAALSGALLCFAPLALRAAAQGNSKRPEKSELESGHARGPDRAIGIAAPTATVSTPTNFPVAPHELPAVF